MVVSITLAVVYVLAGLILGRLAHQFLVFVGNEIQELQSLPRLAVLIKSRLTYFVEYGVYFTAVFLALSELSVLSLVMRVVLAVLGLYLLVYFLVWLKDAFVNLMYAFMLRKQQFLVRGTHVSVSGHKGVVVRVGKTGLTICTRENETLYVPMSYIYRHGLTSVNPRAYSQR